MQKDKLLHLIGYASGLAGVELSTGTGPDEIRHSGFWTEDLKKRCHWDAILHPNLDLEPLKNRVSDACLRLAQTVSEVVRSHEKCCVIGGDHTCALGTWSGVFDALHHQGDIGLIWLDAHMDSHTPQTSESGRFHGMPLAALLGEGDTSFTSLLHAAPKFKPENVCLIGVRSFERGEAQLLEKLNVRTYFMDEIKNRGFLAVLKEARDHVCSKTIGYGLSLDLDGLDPSEVPAVDVPEVNGIRVKDMLEGLKFMAPDQKLIATEIVEFDPVRDKDHITEKIILSFLSILANEHSH